MTNKNNQRITELEMQLSHQTKLIEELDEVVARQSKDILTLKRQLTQLVDYFKEASSHGNMGADAPPPHY